MKERLSLSNVKNTARAIFKEQKLPEKSCLAPFYSKFLTFHPLHSCRGRTRAHKKNIHPLLLPLFILKPPFIAATGYIVLVSVLIPSSFIGINLHKFQPSL